MADDSYTTRDGYTFRGDINEHLRSEYDIDLPELRREQFVSEGDSSEDFGQHYRGSAVIPASEPPPVVNVSLGIIGEALYPPLQIVELPSENAGVVQENPLINLDFFMIPDTFNETFKSRWSAEDLSHGRINPIYNYGGTERQIALSFTLAAFTVAESRSNLRHCQNLARTVYGRYRKLPRGDSEGGTTQDSIVFAGHRNFKVDFGGLIRDETVFINKFAFTADMDAGVFDSFGTDDTDVTHGSMEVVLPRAVKIEIGFTVIHDTLLGFGGQKRVGEPLRWAENRRRDWPHGTGEIDVQEYMKPTNTVASIPTIVTQRHTVEQGSPDLISGGTIRSRRAEAVYDSVQSVRRSLVESGLNLGTYSTRLQLRTQIPYPPSTEPILPPGLTRFEDVLREVREQENVDESNED